MWVKKSNDEWYFIEPFTGDILVVVDIERDYDFDRDGYDFEYDVILTQEVFCELKMPDGEDRIFHITSLPTDREYYVNQDHLAMALEKCNALLQKDIDKLNSVKNTFTMHLELTAGGKEKK